MRMMMNIIDVWMHICFYFIFRRWVIVDVLWRWIIKINWFAGLWNRSKTNAKYFINIQTGHYTTQWKQFSRLMLGLGSLKKKSMHADLQTAFYVVSSLHTTSVYGVMIDFTLIINKAYSAFFKMKSMTVTGWVRSKLKISFNFELTPNRFMISYSFLLDSAIY